MINQAKTEKKEIDYLDFSKASKLVEQEIGRALIKSPPIIRQFTKHLTLSRGKYIRAHSLLACAMNEEDMIHPNAVKFAAAIEILHLATLVHDDIIDDADIRRGEITLQKKHGKKTAVICGDYLMCMALMIGGSVSNKQDYLDLNIPKYLSRICAGELMQHVNNGNLNLSVFQYFKTISGKTAALFEASFYAGAVLCKDALIGKYKRLGHNIGMIFQLTDDCMDFESTKHIAKKPVQSDLEQNVITLPLIFAFQNNKNLKDKIHITTKHSMNDAVLKNGGIAHTRMVAKKYYEKSLNLISQLSVSEAKRDRLKEILDKSFREF